MKVLFLDFDGVLGPYMFEPDIRHIEGSGGPNWETESRRHVAAQNQVRRVIDVTGCKVVITSAWRTDENGIMPNAVSYLAGVLHHASVIPRTDVVVDVTPDLTKELKVRGDEILAWLKEHPEVETYAILDDSSDACANVKRDEGRLLFWEDHPELVEHFVQTMPSVGCTVEDADEVIRLLGAA